MVQGLGVGVQLFGRRVEGVGYKLHADPRVERGSPNPDSAQGSGCRVQGAGFRIQGSGFRVQGSGFRVSAVVHAPRRDLCITQR